MESNSVPANVRVVAGPQVFSGAMGMPRWLHNIRNRSNALFCKIATIIRTMKI